MLQFKGRSDDSFAGEKPRGLVLKGSGMEQPNRGRVGESSKQSSDRPADQRRTAGGRRLERPKRGADTEDNESCQRCGRETKWSYLALPKKKNPSGDSEEVTENGLQKAS